jgi:hypothetical protein
MNSTSEIGKNKIKRRNFFYYIGAAAVSTLVLSKFPFSIFRKSSALKSSSIKVKENSLAVKRTDKGPSNG